LYFDKLVNSPGFTIAAVITLALGIGANVSVFRVQKRWLLADRTQRSPQSP
jgi:hypothetical protein